MDVIECLIQYLGISGSELVQPHQSVNSFLFAAYVVLSIIIKRSSYLAAFFMSCMLFDLAIFDVLSETSLYLLTFSIYSYIILVRCRNRRTTIACGIMVVICITLSYDAYFYGIDGYYGAHETFIYNHIEYIALYSHIILICSFVDVARIRDSVRNFIASIRDMSSYSANHFLLW